MSRILVIETVGTDTRPLGVRDEFLSGSFGESDVAYFYTDIAAQAAIQRAKNRRPGSRIETVSQKGRRSA